MRKQTKKVPVEYKLGELSATVKQLSHVVERLSHEVAGLAEKMEGLEEEKRLKTDYIVISKKKLLGLLGTLLGGLGSLIYYVYLLLSGKTPF